MYLRYFKDPAFSSPSDDRWNEILNLEEEVDDCQRFRFKPTVASVIALMIKTSNWLFVFLSLVENLKIIFTDFKRWSREESFSSPFLEKLSRSWIKWTVAVFINGEQKENFLCYKRSWVSLWCSTKILQKQKWFSSPKRKYFWNMFWEFFNLGSNRNFLV